MERQPRRKVNRTEFLQAKYENYRWRNREGDPIIPHIHPRLITNEKINVPTKQAINSRKRKT